MIKFGYTILYVKDVERSIAFYEKAFGLKRKFVAGDAYGELETGATTLSFASIPQAQSNLKSEIQISSLKKRPFGRGRPNGQFSCSRESNYPPHGWIGFRVTMPVNTLRGSARIAGNTRLVVISPTPITSQRIATVDSVNTKRVNTTTSSSGLLPS